MGLILDSDHCIEILRGRIDFAARLANQSTLYVTTPTVAELWYGGYNSATPERHFPHVQQLLDQVAILAFDEPAAREMGRLKAKLRQQGLLIPDIDLQIASIALTRELPVATHNRRHFERVPGLILLDWLS
jgi:tRNA(fMet)-specific endonuclease VapC